MKMALMLAMIEFTESGGQRGFKFHKSNLSEEGFGLMMALAYVFALNIPIMSGPMILLLTGQEMADQSEF